MLVIRTARVLTVVLLCGTGWHNS